VHRPFSCSICHKRFVQFSTVKIHERIHTGLKNYVSLAYKESISLLLTFSSGGMKVGEEGTHTNCLKSRCAWMLPSSVSVIGFANSGTTYRVMLYHLRV